MRKSRIWMPLAAAVIIGGCGDGESTDTAGGVGGGAPAKPATIISLVVDANRDGVADPNEPKDDGRESTWNGAPGASFLANLDDDDGDKIRDAEDEIVNGPNDALDLAPLLVKAWPDAPDGATGTITLDALTAQSVRVFKQGADGNWTLVGGAFGPCDSANAACTPTPTIPLTTDEIRAGVRFGVEARMFVMSAKEGSWNGRAEIDLAFLDAKGAPITSDEAPNGVAHTTMRVAPWVLFGNLSPFDQLYSSKDSAAFVKGLTDASGEGGVAYKTYSNWDDQWTQDFFQTGWTGMPGPNGTVQGMRVANARPWGRDTGVKYLPYTWLKSNYLGADRAILAVYKKADTGDSYDSHGNHDLIPPYENGADKFPLGRIFVGSGVLPETKAFYDAQQVQGPHYSVDTSWLLVGHIDEVFSYVPAKTARGWKLLVGSPRLAKEMLEKAVADGNGEVKMFVGKKWYNNKDQYVSAEATISGVLANVDVMQWSQEAQSEIDIIRDNFQKDIGLADEDIIEIPFLFNEYDGGKIAFNPGTVNLLAFGDHVVHPDPFGPQIDGADLFKKDLQDRLGTAANALGKDGNGLKVHFADDWSLYHILDGEVHCGSNIEASAPFADVRWWETGR